MCVAKKYQLGGRFWTIAIVVGVMVACVSGMFGFRFGAQGLPDAPAIMIGLRNRRA